MNPVRVLLIGLFAAYMGFAILSPILAPLIRELGLSEIQAGMIQSVAAFAWFLCSPFWGRRSDRIGRKPVYITGLIGLGVGLGMFGLVVQFGLTGALGGWLLFGLLFIGRIIAGAFFSASPAAAQAYVADVTTAEERTKTIALLGAATGMGFVLGPALSGALVSLGLLIPLYVGAVLPIAGGLLVWWRLPPSRQVAREAGPRLRPLDPRIWPFALIGLVANVALIVSQVVAGFYVQDRLGLDAQHTAQTVGIALVVAGIVVVATQLGIVRRTGWSPRRLLRIGLPASMLGYLLLLFAADVPTFILAFALIGVGIGLNEPGFISAMTLAVDKHEYGAVSGITASVVGLASMLAPLLGTGLYAIMPTLPFWLCGGLLLLMVGFVWLHPQIRCATPELWGAGVADRIV